MTTTSGARSRCRELLRQLSVPQPFVLEEFLDRIERRVGHVIDLRGADLGGSAVCGMLLGTKDRLIVLYPNNTTAMHRQHIIVHEFGHLLLGHTGFGDAEEERQAELFATMLLATTTIDIPVPRHGVGDPVLARLRTLFDAAA